MSSTAGCWGCKPSFTTSFVFFFEHLKQSHGATTELTKLSTNNRTGCPLKCHLKRANFPQYYWQCHLLLWRHVHSEVQIHGFLSTRLAKMMRRVFFGIYCVIMNHSVLVTGCMGQPWGEAGVSIGVMNCDMWWMIKTVFYTCCDAHWQKFEF